MRRSQPRDTGRRRTRRRRTADRFVYRSVFVGPPALTVGEIVACLQELLLVVRQLQRAGHVVRCGESDVTNLLGIRRLQLRTENVELRHCLSRR